MNHYNLCKLEVGLLSKAKASVLLRFCKIFCREGKNPPGFCQPGGRFAQSVYQFTCLVLFATLTKNCHHDSVFYGRCFRGLSELFSMFFFIKSGSCYVWICFVACEWLCAVSVCMISTNLNIIYHTHLFHYHLTGAHCVGSSGEYRSR